MRRLAVALLLVAAAAAAQDAHSLPFNPFDDARAGDWETLAVDTKLEGKGAPPRDRIRLFDLVTYRVRAADANEVKVGFEAVPAIQDQDRIATVYSRSVTPSFERVLDLKGTPKDVKATSEKRTIGGRDFACTKITYTLITSRGARTDNTAWFAKDVKAFGLVELVNVIPLAADGKCTVRYTLAGFGSKGTVDFGKRPEELAPKK